MILWFCHHFYGSGIWTLIQKDVRLKKTEIEFMRRTAGWSLLDHRRNEDVLEELKIDSTEKKLFRCKQN
jgi:hypothetical protein